MDLNRPILIPKLAAVLGGIILPIVGKDAIEPADSFEDVGDPTIDGGAEVLVLLCDIVPIVVDEFINGG